MPASLALVLLTACFGPDPNLTESGLAKPILTLEFPSEVEAGSTAQLTVEVGNPGPGDMSSFSVAFAAVAVGGQRGNARSLLTPAPAPGRLGAEQAISSSLTSIDPQPVTVGEGGLVFRFGPLAEEDAASVSFEVAVPEDAGLYANSVQAYDSQVLDRIDAVKLETEVTG